MEHIDRTLLPETLIASDPEVVGCTLGKGAALLHLRTNIYYSLNEVGAFVWNALGEGVPFSNLVARVSAAFDAPAEVVERDVARLVGRLDAAGLVQCKLQ